MMQMMRIDDDSSLHFHYQMRLNLTPFIQIGCQGKHQISSFKTFQIALWMHSKKNFGHESEGPLQLKIAIKETKEEVEPFSEPARIGGKNSTVGSPKF
jgi:hypothetical protein